MYQEELHWIQRLQEALRSPFTDQFFLIWNSFDSFWFILLFVAIIMYLVNRKEGATLLITFLLSGVVNHFLKNTFQLPRPCQIEPILGVICTKSYGLPSGAAQTATIIAGAALAKCRQPSLKILAVIFALFFYFSRIYLGMHFFTDILGGIVVGAGLVWLYLKLVPLMIYSDKIAWILTVVTFFLARSRGPIYAAMSIGIGLGFLFGKKLKLPTKWGSKIFTFLVVIIGTFSLLYFGDRYPNFKIVFMVLSGFWFVYLGPKVTYGLKIEN